MNDCALRVRYAVDCNVFDGCEHGRIAVRPSNRNVAVRRTVRNVVERQRLVRAVDNDCVFARGKSRRIFSIEHILAGFIEFRTCRIGSKSVGAGLLDVNAFQIRIRGRKLDMSRVRVAAV